MTKLEAYRFGWNSALEAIDQAGSYRDLQDAIASYYENVCDTLAEHGARDGQDVCFAAGDGFAAALASRNITVQY